MAGAGPGAPPEGGSDGALERWSGDEHRLQVEAAAEAGLPGGTVELDLFTRGFRHGLTVEDRSDGAIVLRGRTVLRTAELERSLSPLLRFLKVVPDEVSVRVHAGDFELRIGRRAAERAAPALDSLKLGVRLWIGFGLMGLLALQWSRTAAIVVWAVGFVLGAFTARSGLISGRTMLAGRLAVGLAMLAQEEGLVLPPAPPARGSPPAR